MAALLQYSSPAFTALWAALLLGERLTGRTALSLAAALSGVALLVSNSFGAGGEPLSLPWELLGLTGAVVAGAAVATIRELRRTDGAWEIFAAFNLGGAMVTLGPALSGWTWPGPRVWLLMLAVSALSVAAQLAMTWSLRWLPAAVGGLLMQLTPVAALAIGGLFLGERIGPRAWAGAALTLGGIGYGALLGARPPAPEDA